jgi:hypothetical protein
MPIRINLLAETQAAEELRRQDPVKRAIIVGVCLVTIVAIWSISLQFGVMAGNSRKAALQQGLDSMTNEYQQVLDSEKKLGDVNAHLASLNRLSAERFLTAPLLNALTLSTVDGIQLTHFNTDQTLDFQAEIAASKEKGKVTAGRPAAAVEHVKIYLSGRDTSTNPGSEQINKYKEALAHTDYFTAQKISTNNILLKNLSPPQVDGESGKMFVLFSLECSYPDRSR